jgi:sterol desaturase/sphingolipid hydroxylase (fatty acid hydroxylase superfamily)
MTETVNRSRLGRMPDTKAEQHQRWSRAIYVGEIGISIALAMVLLAQSPLPTRDLVALFTGGYFAWTLAEYAVHRFVLHNLVPIEHLRHHAAPSKPIIHVFWQTWAALAIVYFIFGAAFLSGVLVAYAWYLFAHYSAHHNPETFPKALAKHHLDHHKLSTRNFGVSTTLWDQVFGTMLR